MRFWIIAMLSTILAILITTSKNSVGAEWLMIFVLPVADSLINKKMEGKK